MMICCSLDAFMNHSLPFENLIIMCLGVGLFEVILPGAVELLGCLYSCLSSNLRCFQPLFLQIFFLPFLSSPSGIPIRHTLVLFMVFHMSPRICLFFFLFLFHSIDHFHCPIIKFTDSFFCLLKSAFESQ